MHASTLVPSTVGRGPTWQERAAGDRRWQPGVLIDGLPIWGWVRKSSPCHENLQEPTQHEHWNVLARSHGRGGRKRTRTVPFIEWPCPSTLPSATCSAILECPSVGPVHK